MAYERNAKRVLTELESRDAAAVMRAHADEIDARATGLEDPDAQATREWADWIRQHADRTDPLKGRLLLVEVTSCSHEELQPHMHGWSTYGPYRRRHSLRCASGHRLADDLAQQHGGLAPGNAHFPLQSMFVYWRHERDA